MLFAISTNLQRRQLVFGILALVVCIGEFFGAWEYIRTGLEPLSLQAQLPVTELSAAAIASMHGGWEMRQRAQKFAALELQYSQALFELQELQSVRAENRELKRMLENTDRKLTKTVVTAPVVSFAQPTVLVGSADGVEEQAAIVSQGTLLGFVTSVTQRSATVTLLTEQTTKPLLVQTESGIQGLLVGDGRTMWMTEVPAETRVNAGERVTTVGQQGVAKDLLIGIVERIEAKPQDAVQRVQIRQLVSFFTTTIVEVY